MGAGAKNAQAYCGGSSTVYQAAGKPRGARGHRAGCTRRWPGRRRCGRCGRWGSRRCWCLGRARGRGRSTARRGARSKTTMRSRTGSGVKKGGGSAATGSGWGSGLGDGFGLALTVGTGDGEGEGVGDRHRVHERPEEECHVRWPPWPRRRRKQKRRPHYLRLRLLAPVGGGGGGAASVIGRSSCSVTWRRAGYQRPRDGAQKKKKSERKARPLQIAISRPPARNAAPRSPTMAVNPRPR